MITRDSATSKVLVQTEGDIVLRLDRQLANAPYSLWLTRLRFVLLGIASVGCGLLVGVAEGRHTEPSRREAMLLYDVERLQDQVQTLQGAADRQDQRSGKEMTGLEGRLEELDRKLAALADNVETILAPHHDALPLSIPSDAALNPSFQLVFLSPSFSSDASAKPQTSAVVTPKPIQLAQKAEPSVHRHRRPTPLNSDGQDRQTDPALDAASAQAPADDRQAVVPGAP